MPTNLASLPQDLGSTEGQGAHPTGASPIDCAVGTTSVVARKPSSLEEATMLYTNLQGSQHLGEEMAYTLLILHHSCLEVALEWWFLVEKLCLVR